MSVYLTMNHGSVTCLAAPPLVIAGSRVLLRVRAYTPDGELVWERELSDMRPGRMVPGERDPRFDLDLENGSHLGESVVRWSRESILVQYSVTWPSRVPRRERNRDAFEVDSRELLLATGEEVGRTTRLPLVVDAHAGERFYSYENLPYPRVRVFRSPS